MNYLKIDLKNLLNKLICGMIGHDPATLMATGYLAVKRGCESFPVKVCLRCGVVLDKEDSGGKYEIS